MIMERAEFSFFKPDVKDISYEKIQKLIEEGTVPTKLDADGAAVLAQIRDALKSQVGIETPNTVKGVIGAIKNALDASTKGRSKVSVSSIDDFAQKLTDLYKSLIKQFPSLPEWKVPIPDSDEVPAYLMKLFKVFEKVDPNDLIASPRNFFIIKDATKKYSISNAKLPEDDIFDVFMTRRSDGKQTQNITVQGEDIDDVISEFYRFNPRSTSTGTTIRTNTGYFQSFYGLYLLKMLRESGSGLFFPMGSTETPNTLISIREEELRDLIEGLSDDAKVKVLFKNTISEEDTQWMSENLKAEKGTLDIVNFVKWYKGTQDVLINKVVYNDAQPGMEMQNRNRFIEINRKAQDNIRKKLIEGKYFVESTKFKLKDFFEMANTYLFKNEYKYRTAFI